MKLTLCAVLAVMCGTLFGVGVTTAHFLKNSDSVPISITPTDDKLTGPLPTPADGGPLPKVVVNHESFDFGSMERGSVKSHPFTFTNLGAATLELWAGKTTCKCTLTNLGEKDGHGANGGEATAEKVYLQPGETYEVVVEWTGKSFSEQFRQKATIHTNDPARPAIDLIVEGKLVQSLLLEPDKLVFSRLNPSEENVGTLRLISMLDEDLEITNYRFDDPGTAKFFEVDAAPMPAQEVNERGAKGGLLIDVKVKPGIPIGAFRQRMHLTTSAKGQTTLEVPVEGEVSGPIQIAGRGYVRKLGILLFDEVKASTGAKRELRLTIKGKDADKTTLKVVKVVPDVLKVELGDHKVMHGGGITLVQVPLVVEVPQGAPPVSFLGWRAGTMGEIHIETSHPEAKQIRLFVRFAVEP